MIESALIIVPHPDDEINIASGLFEDLVHSGVYTTVVICTNGDYNPRYVNDRYQEAQKVKKLYGYNELIFLGYGDDYVGPHIYDAVDGSSAISFHKATETYSTGSSPEYCFSRFAKHHSYTRDNLKSDIKAVICEKKADLLICVDVDAHPDHRAVSVLFDMSLGEVLKINTDYRPIILKGFAYLGVWYGSYDLFSYSERSMQPCILNTCNTNLSRPYEWEDRISIKASKNNTSLLLWKNKLFLALWANKSQCRYAMSFFPRIANPDVCLWYRSPFNVALQSSIQVSSGNPVFLNDFLLVNPSDIRAKKNIFFEKSIPWRSDKDDKQPIIRLEFESSKQISLIKVYQHVNSNIKTLIVSTDLGYKKRIVCKGDRIVVIDDIIPKSKILSICVVEYEGESVAIEEIECYEYIPELPWHELPFQPYIGHEKKRCSLFAILLSVLYKVYLKILDIIKMPPIEDK